MQTKGLGVDPEMLPIFSNIEIVMLLFRVRGCELHVVPAVLSEQQGVCVSTVRRSIDRLIEVASLISKIADDRRSIGPIWNLHSARRQVEDAIRTQAVERGREIAMRIRVHQDHIMATDDAQEHEVLSGDPCVKCGSLLGRWRGASALTAMLVSYDFSMPRKVPSLSGLGNPTRHSSTQRCKASLNVWKPQEGIFSSPSIDVGEKLKEGLKWMELMSHRIIVQLDGASTGTSQTCGRSGTRFFLNGQLVDDRPKTLTPEQAAAQQAVSEAYIQMLRTLGHLSALFYSKNSRLQKNGRTPVH